MWIQENRMREEVLRTKENDKKEQQQEGPEVQAATSESIGAKFMVLVEWEAEEERKRVCNCEQ